MREWVLTVLRYRSAQCRCYLVQRTAVLSHVVVRMNTEEEHAASNVSSSYNLTQQSVTDSNQHKEILTTWICCVSFIVVVFAVATFQWYRERNAAGLKKKLKRLKEKRASAQSSRGVKAVSKAPIKRDDFVSIYKQKIKDESIKYELQAIKVPTYSYVCSVGLKSYNLQKNFSPKFIPYDYNRVRLNNTDDNTSTDYINASYICDTEGSSMQQTYIAAQGPLSSTLGDFWRMVWQEQAKCIVMLTDIFSYSKVECVKYWHDTYTLCGDIHVMMERCDLRLNYTVRKFIIGQVGSEETRPVYHFLFHGWTMEALPDIAGLLTFRRRVNSCRSAFTVPTTIVHCNTGSGRTGAYIALDKALDTLDKDGVVDILNTIIALRRYRYSFVTDNILLETIYKAFYIRLFCGQSLVTVSALSCGIRDCTSFALDHEYKMLSELIPKLSVGECAAGHRNENRCKSRDIMVQPPERARPHLMTFDMTEHSDFINAVYVDGYGMKNEFIVGQWPVKSSIADFWRLVLDTQITSTVVLHPLQENSKNYPVFWPKTLHICERFGPVGVTLVDSAETCAYSVRTFNVRKYHLNTVEAVALFKYSTTIRIVFFKLWPNSNELVDKANHLITLLDDVSKRATTGGHTFVMSREGVKRAGLYCALSICVQEMINDKEVDVFNAVRTVKQNRPSLVSKVEYMFLNKTINALMKRMLQNKSKEIAQLLSHGTCSSLEETASTGTTLESIADSYV